MLQAAPSVLASIAIASPCPADWEGMTGDDRVRFCGECRLHVYNLSGMSRKEAEALLQAREGRLCVRYFQRADGTIMTRDCPVGLQALHKRKIKRLGKIAAAVTVITVLGSFCVSQANQTESKSIVKMGRPAQAVQEIKGDVAVPPMQGGVSQRMGEIQTMRTPKPANPDVKKPPKTQQSTKEGTVKHDAVKQGIEDPSPRHNFKMGKIAAPMNSALKTPSPKQ
jgi:hypothetical protein